MHRTPGVALTLDDFAAILIEDNHYEILKSRKEANVAKVFRNKGKVKQVPLKSSGTLAELLEKK